MESGIIYRPMKDLVPRSYIEQKVESANVTIAKKMQKDIDDISKIVDTFSADDRGKIHQYIQKIRVFVGKLEQAALLEDNDSVLGLLIAIQGTYKMMQNDRNTAEIFSQIFRGSHIDAKLILLDNYIEVFRQRAKLTDRAVLRAMGYTNGLLTAEVWYKHKGQIVNCISRFLETLRNLSFSHYEIQEYIKDLEHDLRSIQAYECDLNEEPQRYTHVFLFLGMEEDSLRRNVSDLLNSLNPEGPNAWNGNPSHEVIKLLEQQSDMSKARVLSEERFKELDKVCGVFFREMIGIRNKANKEITSRSKVRDSVDRKQIKITDEM